jgi:hypothetical protein
MTTSVPKINKQSRTIIVLYARGIALHGGKFEERGWGTEEEEES